MLEKSWAKTSQNSVQAAHDSTRWKGKKVNSLKYTEKKNGIEATVPLKLFCAIRQHHVTHVNNLTCSFKAIAPDMGSHNNITNLNCYQIYALNNDIYNCLW